jgi:hypothetical protein
MLYIDLTIVFAWFRIGIFPVREGKFFEGQPGRAAGMAGQDPSWQPKKGHQSAGLVKVR